MVRPGLDQFRNSSPQTIHRPLRTQLGPRSQWSQFILFTKSDHVIPNRGLSENCAHKSIIMCPIKIASIHQFWTNLGGTIQVSTWHIWKCSTSCYFDGISVLEHLAIGVEGRMVEAICHRQQNGTACHKNHDKLRKLIRPSRSTAQTNATKKEPIIMCFDHFSLSFLIFHIFHINFPGFLPKSLVFSHHPQRPPSSASRVRPALHRRRSPAQLGIGGVRPGGAQAIGDPRRLSLVTVMTVMTKYPKNCLAQNPKNIYETIKSDQTMKVSSFPPFKLLGYLPTSLKKSLANRWLHALDTLLAL